MNGEEMKRLIADDEDRVLLLRFPKGWGLCVDLGGALLDEAFRSDLVFFVMNQEFWQEGEGWLKYPLPELAVAQLWGRIIRPPLGADYPPPRKTPPQERIFRGKLRPLSGACALAKSRRGGLSAPLWSGLSGQAGKSGQYSAPLLGLALAW